jgi:hypothetical protein
MWRPDLTLRITDADRDGLCEHYAQGRLTLEEFNQRLDAVFAATTQSQLSTLTRDLPRLAASRRRCPGRPGAGQARAPAMLSVPVGHIPVPAVWLLIFGLHLCMFPWPGRPAIFLVIFAAVRG